MDLTGRGDGHDASLYDPKPTDFTNAQQMSGVTDGELYYKLTEGRRPMPSFKKRLTDEQRWRMILLMRTFSKPPTVGPAAVAPARTELHQIFQSEHSPVLFARVVTNAQ